MIYITQLIYLKEGQAAVFDEFEAVAIPLIPKYNGELLLRLRPDPADFIESSLEKPYEIHLVSFPSEADFLAFMPRRGAEAVSTPEGAGHPFEFFGERREVVVVSPL